MPASKIRAIIFDIGRVLVRVDVRRAQVGLAKGLSLTPEELWSAIEKDPRWSDWQEGRMSPARLALEPRVASRYPARFRPVYCCLEQHVRSRAHSSQ